MAEATVVFRLVEVDGERYINASSLIDYLRHAEVKAKGKKADQVVRLIRETIAEGVAMAVLK